MLETLRKFMELIRFSHTIFALPFAALAAVLAWTADPGAFRWLHVPALLLCMIFARSAAMAFNRWVDADWDAANPRTAGRHIPAGLLSRRSVIWFTLICSVAFVASTALFLPNRWPLILSVPVLLFLCGYSLAKRFTSFCHYWLSAALMLSPVAVWIAIHGTVTAVPLSLAAVIFFWVGGFDILYSCQDAEYDRGADLKSIPARLGVSRALWVARFSHLVTAVLLFVFAAAASMGLVFFGAVCLISALLLYEHWLVRGARLDRINQAFFQVNAIISFGILVTGSLDIVLRKWGVL